MYDIDAALQGVMKALSDALPAIPARDLEPFARALSRPEPYQAIQVPDSVPAGPVLRRRHRGAKIYPGVERNYSVYVPVQYDGSADASLLVFQDGSRYLGPEANAARVLDSLIASGELPPTIAVFVDPGERGPGLPVYGGSDNRSIEYDAQGDTYVRFLLEELLPEATEGYRISSDPAQRGLAGISSGGVCAFNAAWERPDAFGKVLSHCGSFVDIRGGDQCAKRVRREEQRPLRVFLQTGEHDLNITFGHWQLANRQLAEALAYRGYAYQLVIGEGGHSLRHGGAILADALRWLWS
ncbi:alpha/beta hydrolase [Pseudoduganella sp. RAF19]|uniref:alpha/beta hydrolase n=1 Tax=Pseudoduganella sp. RAF19 TaxID=3233052 RepID=UPI003F9AC277